MGNSASTTFVKRINFEDLQNVINGKHDGIIINTLPIHGVGQACLITKTVVVDQEVLLLNNLLESQRNKLIIVYGMNASDLSSISKYEQLLKLGFTNVFVYAGGLFEWLLLQDIYGQELFPTTSIELDILKYKGCTHFNLPLLKN
jgi:hypothetical protein